MVCLLMAGVAWLSGTWGRFPERLLWAWAICTPFVQWLGLRLWRAVGAAWAGAASRTPHRAAVVLGPEEVAAQVALSLAATPGSRRTVLGFFDDRSQPRAPYPSIYPSPEPSPRPSPQPSPQPSPNPKRQLGCLGGLAQAAEFIERQGVREVYLCLPLNPNARMQALLEKLHSTTASLYLVPSLPGVRVIQGRMLEVGGLPMLGLCETPFSGLNAQLKRASDLVLGSLILLLISPLMLGVAAGVKLSSPGPVIFRQRRHGLDGQEIIVYKFRSMRVMEDGPVVTQAQRGDPRITRFGAFIRKTSLDELPQFINVLQGRMSIVGPRPHAVAHNLHYRARIAAYMLRHKVKPGITGWAQVNGHRGETDTVEKMAARVEYDLQYLHHWSLALDLKIIARTAALVLFDRQAY
jgi:putative colanic acid biosynthesis UDP-glucose lipid carrier transferase